MSQRIQQAALVKNSSKILSICLFFLFTDPVVSMLFTSHVSKSHSQDNLAQKVTTTKTDVPIDPFINEYAQGQYQYLPEIYNLIVKDLDQKQSPIFESKEHLNTFFLKIARELQKKGISDFHYGITNEQFNELYKGTKEIGMQLRPCIFVLDDMLQILKSTINQIKENKEEVQLSELHLQLAKDQLKTFFNQGCQNYEFRRNGEKQKHERRKSVDSTF